MSQHDFNIANQTASNARVDVNNALVALASNSSGSSSPATTYANMFWYDTASNILKLRNEADSAWINVAYINQGSGEVQPYIGGTKVTDFLDQDTMSSNRSTALASQQSIKAYVDAAKASANSYTDAQITAIPASSDVIPSNLTPIASVSAGQNKSGTLSLSGTWIASFSVTTSSGGGGSFTCGPTDDRGVHFNGIGKASFNLSESSSYSNVIWGSGNLYYSWGSNTSGGGLTVYRR